MKQSEPTPLALALACALAFVPDTAAQNPVIWNGPPITFSKAANADWTEPENQDRITSNVWLTRASSMGIFNIRSEAAYTHNLSPADTEWSYGTTADYASLVFRSWESWNGGAGGGPPGTVGKDAVLHLITDNIYIDIRFTSWGGVGGQFSYERSTPPLGALQSWRLLHFNSAANSGDGADNADPDGDGLVNLIEFAFGLDPKSGSPASLPEPQLAGGVFRASFTQPAGVSGITYGSEWSPTMSGNTWIPVPDSGTGNTHTFEVPANASQRVFLRYVVTVP